MSIFDLHKKGINGNSVTIAFLDTGIYKHIDFEDRIIGFKDYTSNIYRPYDISGHGTHVAGIASGKKYGIAPCSNIVSVKVLKNDGNGKAKTLINGIDWIMKNKDLFNIRIVNISAGASGTSTDKEDLQLIGAVERLWDMGVVIVVAAGNEGPRAGTITIPGISKKVITVGTFDNIENEIFSSRGPTAGCIIKPEIVASGMNIISCKNAINGYTRKSGSSMATPYVSGAIALVLQMNKALTPKQIKLLIHDTAISIDEDKSRYGWGKINVDAMLKTSMN